jgi:hypothetical protein
MGRPWLGCLVNAVTSWDLEDGMYDVVTEKQEENIHEAEASCRT